MATFKLDDQDIEFLPGDTILKAAHRAGVDIPHYCWHPGLSVAANCRMCLVELLPPPGRAALKLDVLRWDPEQKSYIKEQKPKLVPACQQSVGEGMQVLSQNSEHVQKARAAVQELLLLNHPVDCPICDQAGECRLQDYWLNHQHEKKRMRDEPVHKPKAVVFGPTIVYDAERCIVCTRCVRFCEEVAKDPVLSLRERGNQNEIVLAPGRQLDHDYTLMTELVCPVGALTAQDFRFKARVWFLRSARTVCVGCATGCNAYTDYDPRNQQVYRHRPRENPTVNGYWMCDAGMLDYQRIHHHRILKALVDGKSASRSSALDRAVALLSGTPSGKIAGVLGAEYSQRDNAALLWLGKQLGIEAWFESGRPDGKADDILMHADKNPNSAGVRRLLGSEPRPSSELVQGLEAGSFELVLALGSSLKSKEGDGPAPIPGKRIVLSRHPGPLTEGAQVVLPACSWVEAAGSYVNAQGVEQSSEAAIEPLGDSAAPFELVGALCAALGHPPPEPPKGRGHRREASAPVNDSGNQGASAS